MRPDNAREAIAESRPADAHLLDRKVAFEHATLCAEKLDALARLARPMGR